MRGSKKKCLKTFHAWNLAFSYKNDLWPLTLSASLTALSASRAPSLFLLSMVTTGPIARPWALSAEATSCPVPSHRSDGADHHRKRISAKILIIYWLVINKELSEVAICYLFHFHFRFWWVYCQLFVISHIAEPLIQKPPPAWPPPILSATNRTWDDGNVGPAEEPQHSEQNFGGGRYGGQAWPIWCQASRSSKPRLPVLSKESGGVTQGGVEGSDVDVAVPVHVPKLSQCWNKETRGEKSPVLQFISTFEGKHLKKMVVVPQKNSLSVSWYFDFSCESPIWLFVSCADIFLCHSQ